jgi:predicted nucleic acid-binding protein
MSFVHVGPTVLYDLGQIGELELLEWFDGALVIPEDVRAEITIEPARTNLDRFLDESSVITSVRPEVRRAAADALGIDAEGYRAALLGGLFDDSVEDPSEVLVLSDDRRLRALAEGLGAEVAGSFAVVVRAAVADKYLTPEQAKRIVSRMDDHGVQLTGQLRSRAIGEL